MYIHSVTRIIIPNQFQDHRPITAIEYRETIVVRCTVIGGNQVRNRTNQTNQRSELRQVHKGGGVR